MIHIPLDESLLCKHKIFAQPDGSLMKDLKQLRCDNNISRTILDFVIKNLEKIVSCNFFEMGVLQGEYMKLISELDEFSSFDISSYNISDVTSFREIHESLGEIFIKAYDSFTKRKGAPWDSYSYLKELDQTVCPYCNANFIHTIQASKILKGAASRAMADLDHFLPKSIFPIFAITLSNLVPSCIYCNQRFKSAHHTNFQKYFSPFDQEIQDCIKFKISYSENDFTSVFDKLKQLPTTELEIEESHYIKLLSINIFDSDKFDEHKKIYHILQDTIQSIKREYNILTEELNNQTGLTMLLDKIILKAVNYNEKLSEFIAIENIEVPLDNLNSYALDFKKISEEFIPLRQTYEDFKPKSGHYTIKKYVTKFKNEMKKHVDLVKSTFNIIDSDDSDKILEVDFVDVVLGNSTKYQIEILTNSEENSIQRKVYHNAALFQLEAVYNQFRPYINRKIRQSYIVNELYKEQLVNQLPNLLTEQHMNNTIDTLITDPKNQRHEVLGKLTYDVILPAIESRTNLELLKIDE